MLRTSFQPAADGTRHADLSPRAAYQTTFWSWAFATTARPTWQALREGLAAHRRYERLRSRDIPHDLALRAALGCPDSDAPAGAPRHPSCPLTSSARSGAPIVPRGQDATARLPGATRIGNLAFVA
jgi:hypothetical protein